MFKDLGGEKLDIQGLTINLPPVGYVFNKFTQKLEQREVFKRSNKPKEQYWEIPKKPFNVKRRLDIEYKKWLKNSSFFEPELQSYREREWDRTTNGFWFYLKGKPVYITGQHYFMLAHWTIEGNAPDFRTTDMEWHYFWEYCWEDPKCYGMLEVTQRRQGKCLKINELCRMYDGSIKKVDDIKVGDLLMGPDSKPRLVKDVYGGIDFMYEVIPNKGDGFTCTGEHILYLFYNNCYKNPRFGWEPKTFVNINTKDYNSLTDSDKSHLVMVRSGWGFQYDNKDHNVPPYLLGLYLGDGTNKDGSITNPEPEIQEYLFNYADSIGYKVRVDKLAHFITRPDNYYGKNLYKSFLREIDVLDNKHIPKEYLIDSFNNRLELLAGIIDTDGHLNVDNRKNNKKCSYEIIQKNKKLSYDIVELARSLGFYVSINEKIAKLNRVDKDQYSCVVYRIRIFGKTEIIPCKVARKKSDIGNTRQSSLNTGIKIKELPPDRYIGIETDGDHLFLLADGTIVHNSVRAGNAIYYRTSRAKEKKSGIQSKTDADGERLFSKQVVNPMKKLERIFLPLMDKALGSTPKKKISFNKTSSTAEKEDEEIFETKELISEIDFRSSTESAYDGEKMYVYISDECGKVERASIYKRHGMVKPCMTVGKRIIGKMMYTTTVEDIGDADKYDEGNFERLWDESNQNKKDSKTGQTISGLYRYFLPADHALEYDEYGYPKVEENRIFLENQREVYSGNSVEKASYIRRYPLVIEEAFWTPGDEGIYDQIAVQNARDNLKAVNKEDLLIYGNLVWKNGIRGSGVDFIETKHGRFAFHKDFNIKNECLIQNTDIDWTGDYIPRRAKERIIGVDPFDHKEISKGYTGSKAAAYLYIKYMPRNPLSETFVAQYLMRPEDIDEFHEDIAKLAFATGAEVLIENQKQALIKFLGDSKFKQFLVSFDGNTTGVPASRKNKTAAADATAIYIRDSIEKVVFNELLDDWSRFNLKNSTKFDAAMAAGWALLGSFSERTMSMTNTEEKKQAIYDMSNFY